MSIYKPDTWYLINDGGLPDGEAIYPEGGAIQDPFNDISNNNRPSLRKPIPKPIPDPR